VHVGRPVRLCELVLLVAVLGVCVSEATVENIADGGGGGHGGVGGGGGGGKNEDGGGENGVNNDIASSHCILPQGEWAGFPEELDIGLYWFGRNNTREKHGASGGAGCPHGDSPGEQPIFDGNKQNTVIFIHGLSFGQVEENWRYSMDTTDEMMETFLHFHASECSKAKYEKLDRAPTSAFVHADWNIGAMYWDQFADEHSFAAIESKVWGGAQDQEQSSYRLRGHRYATFNTSVAGDPDKEGTGNGYGVVGALLQAYTSALAGYKGSVRLVGHSIGSQMAVRLTDLISAASHRNTTTLSPSVPVPTRVALLDPFFSTQVSALNPQTYLHGRPDETLAGRVAQTVERLSKSKGIVFEAYKSSWESTVPSIGDVNLQLFKETAAVVLHPFYCKITTRHVEVINTYYISMGFAPPRLCNGNDIKNSSTATSDGPDTGEVPSASADDTVVQKAMTRNGRYVQAAGFDTVDPRDDCFEFKEWDSGVPSSAGIVESYKHWMQDLDMPFVLKDLIPPVPSAIAKLFT